MAFACGHLIGAWLVGLIIQKVRNKELTRTSWGLLLIGGILPDIDYLSDWILGTSIHRSFTHSLLFVIIAFGLTYLILKKYNKEKLSIFISIGVLVHIMLDSVYSPGPMIFWPSQYSFAINGALVTTINRFGTFIPLEYVDMGLGVLWTAYLFIKNKIQF